MKYSNSNLLGLFAVIASMAAVAGAQAQSSVSDTRSVLAGARSSYMGLNGGRSDFSLGNGAGAFESEKHDTQFNVYAGSYVNPNFGFEMGYIDFGKVERAGGRTEADGVSLSLVGKVPLGTAFNLLGRLGTTYGRTEVSSAPASGIQAGRERGFGWSYGVGLEYSFNPQWSAVVQYDKHDLKFAGGERDRISAAAVGVRYRF